MATFYLDPEGGNDSNDGTTFANRWKTFSNGATAARTAPGDTIRIIASPTKANVGTATWTDDSATLTLSAAKTATIFNGDASWTGVETNVTQSNQTDAYKVGTSRQQIELGGSFTTGKAAYYTITSTDLSAYSYISFWIYASWDSTESSARYRIRLCSDTTGDTVVDQFDVYTRSNTWTRQYVAKSGGGTLGSAIQSISVELLTSSSSGNITLQNIIACKDPYSDSDAINLCSMIGKDTAAEPEFYPILYIDGTTVAFGGYKDIHKNSGTIRKYRGTSESVTTYARTPLRIWSNGLFRFEESGSNSSPINYSGGWNRTDMSTQTDESWLGFCDMYNGFGVEFFNIDNITVDKVAISHCNDRALEINPASQTAAMSTFNIVQIAASYYGALFNYVSGGGTKLTIGSVVGCHQAVQWANGPSYDKRMCPFGKVDIGTLKHNTDVALHVDSFYPTFFDIDEISNNNYGVKYAFQSALGRVILRGTNMRWNTNYDVTTATAGQQNFAMRSCTLSSSTPVQTSAFTTNHPYEFFTSEDDAGTGLVKLYARNWGGGTSDSVRNTASGVSWYLSPKNTSYVSQGQPAIIPMGPLLVASGAAVTISCYCRRTNTGLTVGILVPGYQLAGMGADYTAEMTAAADTWEQLSVTFTPTETGVVEVYGYAYGGTTYTAYFDDLSIA